MKKLIAALIAAGAITGLAADADAASKKKKAKVELSAAEKKEIREKYMPICVKKYSQGGSQRIIRIQILSDGTVMCWWINP